MIKQRQDYLDYSRKYIDTFHELAPLLAKQYFFIMGNSRCSVHDKIIQDLETMYPDFYFKKSKPNECKVFLKCAMDAERLKIIQYKKNNEKCINLDLKNCMEYPQIQQNVAEFFDNVENIYSKTL